ncbi:hypothetical protein ABW45_07985 [Stenotrophomonas maltophilia]|nr:FtsX-like permease family protein [Stenotrophomonas pavanii]KOQ78086.1 hypothetical protein ABW45_07985 [Stenotrophomonas maltophilia]
MIKYFVWLAVRSYLREKGMLIMLVSTLAIGISACTTAAVLYFALNAESIRGVSNDLHVVTMDARSVPDPKNPDYDKPLSYMGLDDAKELLRSGAQGKMLGVAQSVQLISENGAGDTELMSGLLVLGRNPELLGFDVTDGRAWTSAELDARAPVALIDRDVAQKFYGGVQALGKNIRIGEGVFRVIGIYSTWKPRTQFLDISRNPIRVAGATESFLVPVDAALERDVGPFNSGRCHKQFDTTFQTVTLVGCRWIEVWADLGSAVEVRQYKDLLANFARHARESGRFAYDPQPRLFSSVEWMDENGVIPSYVAATAALTVGFLALSVANAVGMMLARFNRRRMDFGVRRTLGASKRSIFAQAIVESGLIGLIGGAISLPLTVAGIALIRMQQIDFAPLVSLHPVEVLWVSLAAVLIGILIGIIPAWRVCQVAPSLAVK